MRLRVVTYNVHKCRGMDRRVRPQRIVEVLREIDADVIALQEVLSVPGGRPEDDQAHFIAEQLKLSHTVGGTRQLRGGIYGNVVLSRWPITATQNYDISVRGREQRGCLRADVEAIGGSPLHVFNVHLGTAYLERRHQGRRLIDEAILNNGELSGPRLMLGDFNEWTRGLASRLLASHLVSADVRLHLPRARTYPGVLPLLHLDHIYYEDALQLEAMTLYRTRLSLMASDHLPLVADFQMRLD
ncbi:MAG TPA: endonuclease/exonuclease/phosphatase family protein [Blastocatellia bacterium]|nr:endonuclease/exonuclease/phosphatase family protein [Blastocatellia bacterium]